MEIEMISRLAKYWGKNGRICNRKEDEIERLVGDRITLPHDFKSFYKHVDGMNSQDENGFLFYNLRELKTVEEALNTALIKENKDVILFADYMVDSWWYGIRVTDNSHYDIGILPTPDKFVVITTSLKDFINLYLEDDASLYEY